MGLSLVSHYPIRSTGSCSDVPGLDVSFRFGCPRSPRLGPLSSRMSTNTSMNSLITRGVLQTMDEARFFSADSHVNEQPEAWERIPKRLREHGPHFVQDPPGKKGLYMVFDGHEPDPVGMTFTAGQD